MKKGMHTKPTFNGFLGMRYIWHEPSTQADRLARPQWGNLVYVTFSGGDVRTLMWLFLIFFLIN